jgi:hypothetical protein
MNFLKNINGPNGIIIGLGETDPCTVENLKPKILWHCPFKTKWRYPEIFDLEADEVCCVVLSI